VRNPAGRAEPRPAQPSSVTRGPTALLKDDAVTCAASDPAARLEPYLVDGQPGANNAGTGQTGDLVLVDRDVTRIAPAEIATPRPADDGRREIVHEGPAAVTPPIAAERLAGNRRATARRLSHAACGHD